MPLEPYAEAMDIPQAVLNRLYEGRSVSVEVAAKHPEHRAWVEVFPVINPNKGRLEHREWGLEPVLIRFDVTENPIEAFRVRYREIHRRVEAYPDDWDFVGLTLDESYSIANELDLAALLTRWLPDLSELGRHYLDGTPW